MSELSKKLAEVANKNTQCSFGVICTRLSQDDMAAVQDAIGNKTPHYLLAKILREEGYKVTKEGIEDHIQSKCRCFKGKKQ